MNRPLYEMSRSSHPMPSLGVGLALASLSLLGPLSTDLYLAALPQMTQVFSVSSAVMQRTLLAFLAGFALAQLFCGPISDRYGRRPIILGGLVLYIVASVACAMAQDVSQLIGARFVQGIGACVGPVLGRAVVRDLWNPVDGVRVLAYTNRSMGVALLAGPLLGGGLTTHFGWRANFAALAIFAILQWILAFSCLQESNCSPDRSALHPLRMLENIWRLLNDRNYIGYLLCFAFSYCTLFAFISCSAFVLIGHYGLSPMSFGICYASVVSGYILGTQVSGRMVGRFGSDRLIIVGALWAAASGAFMFAQWVIGIDYLVILMLLMGLVSFGVGMINPNSIARALAPHQKNAGVASALIGFVQMMLAVATGTMIGRGGDVTAGALCCAVALCSLLVPASYYTFVRYSKSGSQCR